MTLEWDLPSICFPKLEVPGNVIRRGLDNLISQTEYDVAVTPVYDEGTANPMLGQAVTGKRFQSYFVTHIQPLRHQLALVCSEGLQTYAIGGTISLSSSGF